MAVLTDTLFFFGERIEVRHRLKSLLASPQTKITPTVHVQLDTSHPSRLNNRHVVAISKAMAEAATRSTSSWVQLDFEARDSQQDFYVALVKSLRAQLPDKVKLSVTIRAGWCDKPDLLEQIAADEIVPMFFRMGDLSGEYRARLVSTPESFSKRCQTEAIGSAVQEALPSAVTARYARRYWFNYRNWQ
jgi:hypothetical protein